VQIFISWTQAKCPTLFKTTLVWELFILFFKDVTVLPPREVFTEEGIAFSCKSEERMLIVLH
jgi:hypothetical protein